MNPKNYPYPAFKEKNIPIIFSSDDNYCPYLGVAIKSIINNSSKKNNYDILIFNENISEINKKKLLTTKNKLNNFSIRFINIKKFIKNPKLFYTSSYISIATYYRLFIEKICKNYQKVIYLDCDTIILDDITKLFRINLENKLFGAVIIPEKLKSKELKKYVKKTLKLQNDLEYFNTGVLIINIKKIIEFKLFKKSINLLQKIKNPRLHDQDILNTICFGKIKFINPKFNHFMGYSNKNNKKTIIHYVIEKPWQDPSYPFSEIFWKYARLTPFYEEIIYTNIAKLIKKENNQPPSLKLWIKFKLTKIKSKLIKIYNTTNP